MTESTDPADRTDPTRHLPALDALDSDTPRSPTSRRGLVTILVAVLALVVAGVTGAALARSGNGAGSEAALAAAGGTPSATAGPGDEGDKAQHKGWKGALRGRGHRLGMGGALHGTFVVPDGAGGYRTLVMQHGAATKVSDTSITVRSDDGFEQTYAITADTAVGADRQGVAGIAKGADVAVVGEKKGSGVTALHVADLAALGGLGGQGGQGIGPGGMGGMGGPQHGTDDGDVPTPTATGSAGGTSYRA